MQRAFPYWSAIQNADRKERTRSRDQHAEENCEIHGVRHAGWSLNEDRGISPSRDIA